MATSNGQLKVYDYTVNLLQQLGRGGFGTVYKGWDKDQNTVAIKHIAKTDKRKASTEAVKFHDLKEKQLAHDHIVRVHNVKYWMNSMWIVMELCDIGDLNKFFVNYHHEINTEMKITIMGQIAKGIAFLHLNDIVHRDVKPANILLKTNNANAVVKLGDFGLSKILDPNETSSMSSNVGTLLFKAPEFWDKKPGDRVRYHRNVDVYAAGLTFLAMLQAQSGKALVPKPEGFLQSSEIKMPIGLVAFARSQNKKGDFRMVDSSTSNNDSPQVKNIRCIIDAMTRFSPEARITAAEIEYRMDLPTQFGEMTVESRFKMREPFVPAMLGFLSRARAIGYTGQHLVTVGFPPGSRQGTIRVLHPQTSSMFKWNICHHSNGSSTVFQVQGKEYLLEGCRICKMIRRYDFSAMECNIVCERISPSVMCRGPGSTILVFDDHLWAIYQLEYFQGAFYFINQWTVGREGVVRMCCSEKCHILVLLHVDKLSVTGMDVETGQVAWQQNVLQGNSPKQRTATSGEIAPLPDGTFCFLNGTEILVLDSLTGSTLYTLFDLGSLKGPIWTMSTVSDDKQQKFAFQHGPPDEIQITVYSAPSFQYRVNPHLSLRDINYRSHTINTNTDLTDTVNTNTVDTDTVNPIAPIFRLPIFSQLG